MAMKRVLFVHGRMEPWFGGNAVSAWMLEALKRDHDVTMITWGSTGMDEVNTAYGTDLAAGDVRVVRLPRWLDWLLDRSPTPLSHLRIHYLFRAAGKLREREHFDVVVSGQNEGVLGPGGIQYVHFPWGYYPRPAADLRWYHYGRALSLYRWFCEWLSGFSGDHMSTNVTLVNSDWTGDKFAEVYGGPTRTLYPPVLGSFCPTPWRQRQAAFVCLGRIAPEKEIPKIVAILADVRARTGKPIELHIVGSAYDQRHAREITDLVSRHSGWVRLHTDVSQDEKARLVANCRYGIHGMVREHFGIAPAEIQRAGSIVFVPADGGAAEIVAHDQRLIYHSPEDAVDKICRVLDDEKLERELVELAASRHEVFTEQRFVREFRAIVDEV